MNRTHIPSPFSMHSAIDSTLLLPSLWSSFFLERKDESNNNREYAVVSGASVFKSSVVIKDVVAFLIIKLVSCR